MEDYGTLRWSRNISLQLDELWEIVETLQASVSSAGSSGSSEVVPDYSLQIKNLQTAVSQLQLSLSSVTDTVNQNTASIEELQTKANSFETLISELQEGISANSVSISDLQTALLNFETTLSTFQTDFNTLSSEFTTVKTDVSNLVVSDAQNTQNISMLQANYLALESSVATIESNVASLETTVTSVQQDMVSVNNSVASVQSDVSTLNESVLAIQGSVDTLDGSVGAISQDLSLLEGTVSSVQGEVSTLNSAVNMAQSDLATLNNTVSTVQSDVSVVQSDVESLKTETQNLSATLLQEQEKITLNQTNIESLSTSVENLRASDATQNTEISEIKTDIENLQNDVQTLQNSGGSGQTVDLSLYKTIENDTVESEIRNVGEYQRVSTICEIEARLTADTTYKLDSFKCLNKIPTKISFLFCARAYQSGEYGTVMLNFYFDETLIHSVEVTCEDDEEHLFEFEYNFIPTAERQTILMEMVHQSLTESGTNVRICVQYVNMTLHGQNCWFYESENAPIAIDFNAPNTGRYVGEYPVFTFGNISRYLKFYEVDAVTKNERNWNVGTNGTMRAVQVPSSRLVGAKKCAIYHYYSNTNLKVERAVTFTFVGQGANCSNRFIPNFSVAGSTLYATLHTSSGFSMPNCSMLCPLEVNNQTFLGDTTVLTSTSYLTEEKMYGGAYLAKDDSTKMWKAMLTFYKDNISSKKTAYITIPSIIGEIVDACSCFHIFDSTFPYFGMALFVSESDKIFLCALNLNEEKMGEQFSTDFLYILSDDTFPLYIGKGINPFGTYKDGKVYVYYSYINRIYCRVFDVQSGSLSKPKYVCDGQYYSEGVMAYHIRKEGVMTHVCKCDLPQ